MADIERHDPFGGAYGAALATRAGDFVFTSVAGAIELRDGVPAFADGFDEQLRIAGRNAATELAAFGFRSSDIVDSTVFVHPTVEIDPDLLRDALSEQVFGGAQPSLTVVRAPSTYEASLIVIKIIAFKSSR
jgi:enamine deaminase RidA (YjgF/YER057c/UK114 family)